MGVGRGTKFVPPYRPGVSLALDAGTHPPLIAPSSLGKEMPHAAALAATSVVVTADYNETLLVYRRLRRASQGKSEVRSLKSEV